ncbi:MULTISPECIES: hydroxyacid dehydrogenase [unclassified Sinorhizobium]|uniref:hydroxyacid dehydrogenase n=1 Tax=unclassified Sinorhizobium TaxID=2613772 RepID=UPI0024C2FD25|nr:MULTISPECIES: hydroxyacid dehydrogenase [unclassified Sinorhizobium]MDK1377288.1 hydroxyacid dehydrogenase [Sinorhizobium sp. 6-70]MDK1481899.1 hydroxyacid dehydrogenase [Sinorhizobium sp. 6-117]
MAEIVISEFMDEAALDNLRQRYSVTYDPSLVDNPDRLQVELADAVALIVRNRTRVNASLLDHGPHLRCVGRLGVGLDNIDLDECRRCNVSVHPATGANDLSVAEYVMTAALMLLRGAWLSTAAVASGSWPRQTLIGRELAGRTMGLVGFGAIAREVAWRAQAMGMQIVAYDPHLPADNPAWQSARNMSLEGLLEVADVVSLHVPLTPATTKMIGATEIAGMNTGAVLINAARGGVVDEQALADALRAGKLGGAALDVFEVEPLTAEAGAKFVGIPNLLLTPHIAGVTDESNVRVSSVIAEKVLAELERTR